MKFNLKNLFAEVRRVFRTVQEQEHRHERQTAYLTRQLIEACQNRGRVEHVLEVNAQAAHNAEDTALERRDRDVRQAYEVWRQDCNRITALAESVRRENEPELEGYDALIESLREEFNFHTA